MRLPSLVLCLAIAGGFGRPPAGAVEFAASGIAVSFFDDSGKLTHKLAAKHGSKAGSLQNLREVEVLYFSANDASVVVQRLETDEATWDDRLQTLVGRGRFAVITAENRLTGEGFDFALATSRLQIHRHFMMTNAEVVVTSDRATAELGLEKAGESLKLRDVKRCEASGQVRMVVQPSALNKYRIEEAFSETAIYDGAMKTIFFPKPTRTLSKGVAGTSNSMTIHLRDSAAPAAKRPPP